MNVARFTFFRCFRFTRQWAQGARGFTLIELMVTLLIVAVLSIVASASFRGFIEESYLLKEQREWVKFLKLARGEAVSRGYPVSVCRVPLATSPDCSVTSDSSPYWLMLVLEPDANNFDQTVLKRVQLDDATITANAQQFVFRHTGHLRTEDPDSPSALSAVMCGRDGTSGKQKILQIISSGVFTIQEGVACA